jgi:competence protein ComFB
MKVYNIMENFVYEMLETILKTKPEACDCEQCRADIAAMALNQLKPRYVASKIGDVFSRTEMLDSKMRAAILVTLTEATEKVASNPRHTKG